MAGKILSIYQCAVIAFSNLDSNYQNHNFYSYSSRTCVPEHDLCLGIPLCSNNADIKFCKETSVDSIPDWIPLPGKSFCPLDHKNTSQQGQQIQSGVEFDGVYNCLNRLDEDPFRKSNQTEIKKSLNNVNKIWWENINKKCSSSSKRRCLGFQSDTCVFAEGEYFDCIKSKSNRF